MAQKKSKRSGLTSTNKTVAENKRARFDYQIEETFEAGIALAGTEVKSLRMGQGSINESYVGPKQNEIWLFNAHIPEYGQAGHHLQHNPKRIRKLLLHRREVNRLMGAVTRDSYTIIPTRLYFDKRGLAKLEIGLGKGKKLHDKRQTEKDRDWSRQKAKIMKDYN